jgi:hypothetical protein
MAKHDNFLVIDTTPRSLLTSPNSMLIFIVTFQNSTPHISIIKTVTGVIKITTAIINVHPIEFTLGHSNKKSKVCQ